MVRDSSGAPRVDIAETHTTPRGDSREEELRAELRAAREVLAVREMQEQGRSPVHVPETVAGSPRVASMSTPQVRSHIERLERDLRDAQTGRATMESLSEDAAREDD